MCLCDQNTTVRVPGLRFSGCRKDPDSGIGGRLTATGEGKRYNRPFSSMITILLFIALCLGLALLVTIDARASHRGQPVRVARQDRQRRAGPDRRA
jgi:hypothetical protein